MVGGDCEEVGFETGEGGERGIKTKDRERESNRMVEGCIGG